MSSSSLTPFVFGDALVRIHTDADGNPWFVAKDVCRVLEISNHNDAMSSLEEDEKDGVGITDPIGREQRATIVSESGLYSLIFRSRKPEARRFRKWVTAEVLPAIRQSGHYGAPRLALAPAELPPIPEEALTLPPGIRQRLWHDALQTARLDNAGSDVAARWFAYLCRMVGHKPPTAFDEVREFFDECCVRSPGKHEKAFVLYDAFRHWRQGSLTPMLSMKAFGQNMLLFTRSRKSNGILYCDITLQR